MNNFGGRTISLFVCAAAAVGLACAAKFSADGNWYRAKVTDVSPFGLVTVTYVDYGNSESVPVCDVRKLLQRFLDHPPQVSINCQSNNHCDNIMVPWLHCSLQCFI